MNRKTFIFTCAVFLMFLANLAALEGQTVLVANFTNGNTNFFRSRVYLWNPSSSDASITVRVFSLTRSGPSQLLGTADLGLIEAETARNIRLEDIFVSIGLPAPYEQNNGNTTLEFRVGADNVRGSAQVFNNSLTLAFGTYPLQVIPTGGVELLLEQVLGLWLLQYTINITPFADGFVNFEVIPSTDFDFVAVGLDEFFDAVVIFYDDVAQEFLLFDEGITISQVFSFNFNAGGTISGCYFLTDVDFSNPDPCRSMTGVKLDLSTTLVSPPLPSLSPSGLTQTNIESMKLSQDRSANSANNAGLLQSKDLNIERVIERFRSSEIGKELLSR